MPALKDSALPDSLHRRARRVPARLNHLALDSIQLGYYITSKH